MSRFFKEPEAGGFRAPDTTPKGAVPIDVGSTDDKSQTPVRKTEGGRYTDEDYAKLKDAFG